MQSISPMKDVSTDEALRLINPEIESHREAILALISERNQVIPISKLPPEILCKIFLYVKIVELEDNFLYSYSEWRRWIYLGHVSSYWRSVVLTFPTLWDIPLPLALPHWVKEVLERSRGTACLSIHVNFDFPQSIQRLKMVLPHGWQIKHPSLTNMQLEHREILEELTNSILRLESLSMSGHIPQYSYLAAEGLFIPDGLLTDGEQHLRRLELSNCRFAWPAISPHITHLQLHYIAKSTESTFSHFMDALGKMAEHLQHLELISAFPLRKSEQEKASPRDRINFPLLQKLVVSCINAEAKDFFPGIHFPRSTTTDITLRAPFSVVNLNGDPDFSVVLSSIADAGSYSRSVSDLDPFRTLFITVLQDYYRYIWLMLFTDVFADGPADGITLLTSYRSVARLSLRLEHQELTSSISYINRSIIPAFFNNGFPLDKVSHVHLDIDGVESMTLAETVGMLPAVSFINAEGEVATAFIDALNRNRRQHGGTSASEMPYWKLWFPKLNSIRIEDVVFLSQDSDSNAGLDIDSDMDYAIDVDILQNCLTHRHDCGAGIHKLALWDCDNLSDKNIVKLREIVAEVDWDDDPDWEEDNDRLSDGSSYSSDEDDNFGDEGDSDHPCSDSEGQELAAKLASDSEDSI